MLRAFCGPRDSVEVWKQLQVCVWTVARRGSWDPACATSLRGGLHLPVWKVGAVPLVLRVAVRVGGGRWQTRWPSPGCGVREVYRTSSCTASSVLPAAPSQALA